MMFRKKTGIERLQKNKKLSALDKYVIFSFSVLIVFTIACIIIYCIKGDEPSTLIASVFSTFGGELLLCAMIKRLKLKRGDSYGQTEE